MSPETKALRERTTKNKSKRQRARDVEMYVPQAAPPPADPPPAAPSRADMLEVNQAIEDIIRRFEADVAAEDRKLARRRAV